ncbi:MAG: hypothetical protein AAFZ18_22495 [Myxococcota bacterium]
MVDLDKLWDVFDYGLTKAAAKPRGSSLLGPSERAELHGGLRVVSLEDREVEELFDELCQLDMAALSREAWELDDFWATPEDDEELDELRDEIVALLISALERNLSVHVVD